MEQAEFDAIVGALPARMAMLDRDLRYTGMTALYRSHYFFTVSDPVGRYIADVHEHFPDLWMQRLRKALAGETIGMDEEQMEVRPGQTMWLSWQLVPWRDASGQVGGVVLMSEDISERKESEMRLRQATKLTALAEMAGGIAHEINNPLSILRGFVDLMQRHLSRGNADKDTFQQYLLRSRTTIDRIARIVNGMKRIARDPSLDAMQSYGVDAIVEDALDFVREKFLGAGIRLEVESSGGDVTVHCRPVEISQVMLNLFTNAFHALEGRRDPWMRVAAQVEGGWARFTVEDGGQGVAVENRPKIFQPFFTTKDAGQGMGLGLSVSRRILEGHQGRLYLDENAPHTRFVAELPLVPQDQRQRE